MENTVILDRRRFLLRSASFLAGTLLGLNALPRAHAASRPMIALIIDDIGYSLSRARQFLDLDAPITFAILPRLARSHDLAQEIHARGHEIMLHQPMEPYNSSLDPGPGALFVGDGTEKIVGVMEENITQVPFAAGVNNHMGSKFTASPTEMKEALSFIKGQDLFFVDSLTSGRSTAYRTAKRLHMATACRNVFLDNVPRESAVFGQLCKLQKCALSQGRAIGIGHPFLQTARALQRFLEGLPNSECSLVHASQVLDG
jgi:polysaccharide deacetylase 2 family uncharacterized protein YibQ